LDTIEKKKSRDFNIYYLNFSKVYEIAMMINNVILTKIETDKSTSFEEQYGFTSSISAQGTKQFLDGIKASISADARETSTSSSKVVESLDVKTTKSILLRRIIEQCASVTTLDNSTEGDLVKVDHVKLELLNEESLRQFLILRRDALKGMRVEGMEINNLVSSMLQDYAYILKGTINNKITKDSVSEIIIKIPMEIQSEFENKYNINDLLIGHVSIVGIYKGIVGEEFITSNTFTYFQEVGSRKEKQETATSKIIKSNTQPELPETTTPKSNDDYHFIDTLAIIQDVTFKLEESLSLKLHWWNRFGIWLSKLWRK
jgi:transcriptional regulator NrdR family protein